MYVCACLREVGTKDIFSAVIFVLWVFFYPLGMLIITNLNASDVALMFFLDVVFELMSLQ